MVALNSIFLSYRRSDSNDVTGRIYDHLISRFGRKTVFKDVDSIPYGVDFREHLADTVGKCRVVIAVIGPAWLEILNERANQSAIDWVQAELETALRQEISVIPLLIGETRIPIESSLPENLKALAHLNAARARPDPDFKGDISKLVSRLEEIIGFSQSIVLLGNSEIIDHQSQLEDSTRKEFYKRQITQLKDELAAVEADLAIAPRQLDKLKLGKEADRLINEIEKLRTWLA